MVKTPTKPLGFQEFVAVPPEADYRLPDFKKKQIWQRLLVGMTCLGLGGAAIAFGLSSVTYRLTHATVDGGLISGRTVRLRAPIDGKLKAFYARPGAPVKSGQILARLESTAQVEQNLLQLQGEVQTKTAQLVAAKQSLVFLQQQLSSLEIQDKTLQRVNTGLSAKEVTHQQAAVEAAMAKEKAARLDYQRYQQLLQEGAISRQKVDQLEFIWKSAEAEVKQAQAELSSAQASLGALQDGVALTPGATLADQRMNLMRSVQGQAAQIETLEAELDSSQKQLKKAQAEFSDRQDIEISAPFTGVVYSTEHDQGEQVNRPDTLITLLDCNDLWVETLVSTQQANQIDSTKPVRVQLAGAEDTFVGEVELIEAVNRAELAKDQAQALVPAVASNLVGQPLAKVTVRIPPAPQQSQTNQFCGVGQSARMTFGTKLLAGK
ncbi:MULTISPECIES: HlyD family secretion protein [Trichocoleus]|uniref:HlyD family secretion protein n=1 Tax=Trichocoleus desertorum GB2-A4 TaxID=2933944 RepID=A0ABV0J1V3_9CYAN|nr:HlyD family efflux transporter periplasmic adaptor subunit [Trichocoleus sp. FACHB-46]MBD1860375.1 efflux RND transporter periplasmic adaptor subunit [Trichocoleus sp. FACHB-46]